MSEQEQQAPAPEEDGRDKATGRFTKGHKFNRIPGWQVNTKRRMRRLDALTQIIAAATVQALNLISPKAIKQLTAPQPNAPSLEYLTTKQLEQIDELVNGRKRGA